MAEAPISVTKVVTKPDISRGIDQRRETSAILRNQPLNIGTFCRGYLRTSGIYYIS